MNRILNYLGLISLASVLWAPLMDRLMIFGESGISLSNLYIYFAAFMIVYDLGDYDRDTSVRGIVIGALLLPIWLVVRKWVVVL